MISSKNTTPPDLLILCAQDGILNETPSSVMKGSPEKSAGSLTEAIIVSMCRPKRLTSELILLFLYLGFISLQASIDNPKRADKAGAILALVGVVNVPIIYFSVKWWNTLHQGASVSLTKAPAMAQTMLWGMLLMTLCLWMYSIAVALMRVRAIILERESHADWVRQLSEVKN